MAPLAICHPKEGRWHHHSQIQKAFFYIRKMNINLACCRIYFDVTNWLNLDYVSAGSAVQQANLLGRLPFADATSELVHSPLSSAHPPLEQPATCIQER